ncbi:uncharacterized protein LOC119652987 [Hermetia illucens]|uniref:uncharacterized protein LOC119652987 n=1 Tax=Hermetia illucens TaxID=343691 RepID=UPI0018CC55FD|nr:uncharacterized protein LOC119652987 [Hermetia illucens]
MKSMLLPWLFVLLSSLFIGESTQSPHRFIENERVVDALDQILSNAELQNLLSSTNKYPERTKISAKGARDYRYEDTLLFVLYKLRTCLENLVQRQEREIFMTPRVGRDIAFIR